MGNILTRFLKNRTFLLIFVWLSICPVQGQIDSIWKVVPIDFNGLSKIIDGSDFLRLSGQFTKVDDTASIVVILNSDEKIQERLNLIYAWQINASLIWKGRYIYGGSGLWVEQSDSFVNVLRQKDDVYAICDLGDSLVLAGSFRNDADSVVACLLVCDTNFSCRSLPFLNNLYGDIYRLELYDSALIAAGNFNKPGGFKEIAQYRKGTWSPLDNGILGGGDEWVDDMLVFQDTLYVSGRFYEDAGNGGSLIMRWDGQNWLQTGKQNTGVQVHDLFVYQNQVVASGIITSTEGTPVNDLVLWNGTSWNGIPVQMQHGRIFRMGEFNGILYLSGDFREYTGAPISYLIRMRDSVSYKGKLITRINGVEEEKNGWLIYPNPSNGIIHIANPSASAQANEWGIEIFNSIGMSMNYELNVQDETQIQISVKPHKPGIYLVRICLGANCYVENFLIK